MKKALIITALAGVLAACGPSDAEKRELINAYEIKNPSVNIRKFTTTYFIEGTVDSRSLGWIDDNRSRARLGCYRVIGTMGGIDATRGIESEYDLCIYYVIGPEGAGGKLWPMNRGDLEGLMKEHDFRKK